MLLNVVCCCLFIYFTVWKGTRVDLLTMTEWNNDSILSFLELYQGEPCIWDPKHSAHKNKAKVHDAWVRIQSSLNAEMSIPEIKKKKDSLMASFRHHMRRKNSSITSGAGTEDIYKPSWFAFEIMESFLGRIYECDTTCPTENTVQHEEASVHMQENEEESNTCTSDALTPVPTHSTTECRCKRPPELEQTKQISEAFSIFKYISSVNKDDDECDLYGKLLAKKLKKIPEGEREQLMYEIDGLFLRRNWRFNSARSSNTSSPSPIHIHYSDFSAPVQLSRPRTLLTDDKTHIVSSLDEGGSPPNR